MDIEFPTYKFDCLADEIEELINNQGKEKDKYELFSNEDYYIKYPEEKLNQTYSISVQNKLKESLDLFRRATIYSRRIQKFLDGDDGEHSFLERLKEEIEEYEYKASNSDS